MRVGVGGPAFNQRDDPFPPVRAHAHTFTWEWAYAEGSGPARRAIISPRRRGELLTHVDGSFHSTSTRSVRIMHKGVALPSPGGKERDRIYSRCDATRTGMSSVYHDSRPATFRWLVINSKAHDSFIQLRHGLIKSHGWHTASNIAIVA